ncbi:MAG: Ldh family oxidoreductase [Anaerolineae bacterium]|nr:Ldh family oxidoreductase [Anaerolineae bacterium]
MPIFSADQLRQVGTAIFVGAGAPPETAALVADHLVESNLLGHDSHGITRLTQYVRGIERGYCVPHAQPCLLRETATTALVDGCSAFGTITARYATDVLIRKTRESQVAAVGILRCNHLGRLGEYAERAAEAGVIAMMALTNSGVGRSVAPYGGARGALATNPIAFGIPAGKRPPIVADFATSTVAHGKIGVYRDRGEPIPEGWIVDKDGQPTTDPNDLFDGGVLLPAAGHKGFALALVAETLGAALTGATEFKEGEPFYNCVFMWGVRTDVFQSTDEYERIETISIEKSLNTPPAAGFQRVMMPGEPERLARAVREKAGIEVPDETWKGIRELAERLGVLAQLPEIE